MAHSSLIKGISVCNPVDIDRDYLLYTVEYAAKNGYDHLQIIGPIHDYVKGNIDGMIFYRKYSDMICNNADYVHMNIDVVNEACKKAKEYNIKTYMWHHELYLPPTFKDFFPEVLNDDGDIEVSHPLVKDFLENKIKDFFHTYPFTDGIILTLHETQTPLLKLKNQKLGKIERVKYVTKILYNTCVSLGKELIVRPFASIEEDYEMMTKAYEEISQDLMIMDKWTQFDWSLTMPSNQFFNKIKKNPLFVEADVFGEYFGKGRLPLMLKKHIADKFEHCSSFNPAGYVARIDRNGEIPFGDINEVNIDIMNAHLNEKNENYVIDSFFSQKYPDAADELKDLMEQTEDILIKTIYIKGYLFSEMSIFPMLNHCKNHYYFEMMKKDCVINSNEWFIPKDWKPCKVADIIAEKQEAVDKAEVLFERFKELKGKIKEDEYKKLWEKFCNLMLVTKIWKTLALVHVNYIKFFETGHLEDEQEFYKTIDALTDLADEGKRLLGDKFYCFNGDRGEHDYISEFTSDILTSFKLEKETLNEITAEDGITDYIVCGGATEGHQLQKEVNFSDTMFQEDSICRIPGNRKGMNWSAINAHGWFSYQIKVKPFADNTIKILMSNPEGNIYARITIGEKSYEVSESVQGKKEFIFIYDETKGSDFIRIRFDKISGYTPCIHTVIVK